MFVVGKSGFITIPNKTQYSGWNKKQVSGVDKDGHGWVDLDLPSGTIWCTENFGGDWAEYKKTGDGNCLIGALCPWGSVDYTNYSQSTTDIGGTDQDIVTMAWGKTWRIPSWDNAKELMSNTTHELIYGYLNNVQAYVWTGKNDEIIVMPVKNINYRRYLWTSTPSSIDTAYEFDIDGSTSLSRSDKSEVKQIRPIMVK